MTQQPLALAQLIAKIDRKFISGNPIPVERASITAEEWAVIKAALNVKEHKETKHG